jgi:MFS family permease
MAVAREVYHRARSMSTTGERAARRSHAPAVDGAAAVSWAVVFAPPHALPAAAVILCTLSPAFGVFITATVLPSVVAEIGGLAFYAWASTAYAVTMILGSAGSSVVVRRAGTRGTLLVAAAILAAGTVTCASAPAMAYLVVGRTLQGLGGGMMTATVHGVVHEAFPEALWPRMLATISGAWGLAAMSGPAVGGVLAGLGHWRIAFLVTVPFLIAAALMTWRILPRRSAPADRASRVPLGRLSLVCGGVLCVAAVANVHAPAARVGLLVAAAGAIALMLRLDGAAAHRLFPPGLLSLRRPVGKGFWMIFFVAISTTPTGVYLPLLLQVLHEVRAAAGGYFYAAQSFAWTLAALIGARLVGARARNALMLGPILIAAGFVGLHSAVPAGPLALVLLSVILVGAGIGACWAHVGSIVLGTARPGEGAMTASLIPTTQTFAVSLGAAVCGIIAGAAGLSQAATPPVAALAASWLFGGFLLAPLAALAIASRLAR